MAQNDAWRKRMTPRDRAGRIRKRGARETDAEHKARDAGDAEPVRIVSLRPILPKNPRVLVLGTMPSVRSLAAGEYYAHPQNAFWRIMCALFQQPYPLPYAARVECLCKNGVALWDVCQSCIRPGSADSDIREVVPNPIGDLVSGQNITTILFNGRTAEALARRNMRDMLENMDTRTMPSTSPAHTMPFDQKLLAWSWILTKL